MAIQQVNLGKVQPLWRGEFTSSPPFNYKPTDQLSYNDSAYLVIQESDGSILPTDTDYFLSLGGIEAYKISSMITWVSSQYASGDESKVATIAAGLDISSYDYFVYPDDYRVYAKNGATGAFSNPLDFDPDTGIDSGLTGAILNVNNEGFSEKNVSIGMADSDYSLTDTENMFGRVTLTGSLTADRVLTVSTTERSIAVVNSTTGGFSVKVKTPSGTGVHVPHGETYNLRCSEGNVNAATGNVVTILSDGVYSSGSYSYPNSRTESDFLKISAYASQGIAGEYLGNSEAFISEGWSVLYAFIDSGGGASLVYQNSSSFSVSVTGNRKIKRVTGILNDGVTY